MTDDISSEKELKLKINEIRSQIARDEKELKSLFNELRLHRTNIEELKEKRNNLNNQVKEMVVKARDLRKKRDEINTNISELKVLRNEQLSITQQVSEEISKLKAERDTLNQVSKGTVDILSKAYKMELDTLLNADVPLQHEINLFDKLMQLQERLIAALKADSIHKKMQKTYDENLLSQSDGKIGTDIKELANISQQHHIEMVDLYKTIDEIRKDADLAHSQIKEKFAVTGPLRAKIDPLKNKMLEEREELNVYLEKLNVIQLEKDERKLHDQRIVAKEKLEKTGKMSLQDLKVLMENGDLNL